MLALAGVLQVTGPLQSEPANEARVLASMPLNSAGVDAGADVPLFTLTGMAPGERYERCIVIVADSAGSGVRFAGGGVSGVLAPWLTVEGTTGTGTARDCGDFVASGPAFYTGTLAALDSVGTDGVPTDWVPTGPDRRTFRLAVEVADDARAAGAQAVATLVWQLDGAQAPPTTDRGTSSPVTRAPITSGPVTSAPVTSVPTPPGDDSGVIGPPGKPDGPGRPTRSGAAATPSVSPPGSTAARQTPAPASARPGAPAMASNPSTSARVGQLLTGVARVSVVPLFMLLLLLLFLALQDRLDRNDPKLALAPLYGRQDQAFPDTGTTPWRTR